MARIATPYVPALLLVVAANEWLITTRWGAPGTNTGVGAFVGNLLMLQDHSLLRILEIVKVRVPWHVLPYNTAEPFWTVSIEMWIYVAAGLFVFCVLGRDRIRAGWYGPLALLSVPVVIWNAAAGGGKCLSLIWLLGAAAGCALARWSARGVPHGGWLAFWLLLLGVGGLVGRVAKQGFDGFDLQTVALIASIVFGGLIAVASIRHLPRILERVCQLMASYSYSLYLIHNTVLVAVFELLGDRPRWLSIAIGLVCAHLVAIGLYLAFERHHRRVGHWLRPRFERAMVSGKPAAQPVETAPLVAR